jgi:hypothetical protein
MPPSPLGKPWVVEIEDPASVQPGLLHISEPLAVPTTPAGGRRRCSSALRSWVSGSREPRHRRESSTLRWSQLVTRRPRRLADTRDRATVVVGLTCTVIGVWLGLLAPASSPVSAHPAAGVQHRLP